jgi:GTP-binding protein HflX
VRRRRGQLRERRHKAAIPTVALVGYTNAGKTTLFNALTGQDARASDALFVTLDPLVRRVKLPDTRQLLISDTVGFIERLPHQIVAAFRATLEEAAESDLLLHVIDAAATERERHIETVRSVLMEIGASRVPAMEVFNKTDLLEQGELKRLRALHPAGFCISALHGEGRSELLDAIASRLALDTARVTLEFDSEHAPRDAIADLYRHGRVLRHMTTDGRVSIEAELPRRVLPRFAPYETR